jgi:hypothetical protein
MAKKPMKDLSKKTVPAKDADKVKGGALTRPPIKSF